MGTRAQNNSGSDSAQVLSLSLFLMLLAFFIVLSTFSDFEENKVSAVQSSVEGAFSSDIMGETGTPAEAEGDDFAENSGQAFDDIEAVLKAQIGLISITRDADSGIMVVSVPEKSVFEDHLSPYDGNKTLAGEITSIITRTQGKDIGFQVKVNGHLDSQTLAPQEKIKGLGIFARSMIQKGIDPDAISIGLVQAKPGYVDLIFDAYRGAQQKELDFESAAPKEEQAVPE